MRSFTYLVAVFALATVVFGSSPPLSDKELSRLPIKQRVQILAGRLRKVSPPRHTTRTSFKSLYISQNGQVTSQPQMVPTITLQGTTSVSDSIMQKGAKTIAAMVKNMSPQIFAGVAQSQGCGLFTQQETLAVYPEFAYLNKPGCEGEGNCYGQCATTCGSDGRKSMLVAGLTSRTKFSAALAKNVDCQADDPYAHQENVLGHEFAHQVKFSLPQSYQTKITQLFTSEKFQNHWVPNSYAMSTEDEFWAEASASFFGIVTRQDGPAGGMDACNMQGPCANEAANRNWLAQHDPTLYNLLADVYTQNQPQIPSGAHICWGGATSGGQTTGGQYTGGQTTGGQATGGQSTGLQVGQMTSQGVYLGIGSNGQPMFSQSTGQTSGQTSTGLQVGQMTSQGVYLGIGSNGQPMFSQSTGQTSGQTSGTQYTGQTSGLQVGQMTSQGVYLGIGSNGQPMFSQSTGQTSGQTSGTQYTGQTSGLQVGTMTSQGVYLGIGSNGQPMYSQSTGQTSGQTSGGQYTGQTSSQHGLQIGTLTTQGIYMGISADGHLMFRPANGQTSGSGYQTSGHHTGYVYGHTYAQGVYVGQSSNGQPLFARPHYSGSSLFG